MAMAAKVVVEEEEEDMVVVVMEVSLFHCQQFLKYLK